MATFYNQATLRYNNTVTNSNVASGELVEVLSVTKTAVRDTYQVGEDITYAVSILNSGATPLNGLTLTDDLGAYTVGTATVTPLTYGVGSVQYYVNGVLQPTPAVTVGPPLQIGGINVPAGGNALVLYEAQVNAFAPPEVGGHSRCIHPDHRGHYLSHKKEPPAIARGSFRYSVGGPTRQV